MILFLIIFKLYKKRNPKHVVFLSCFILKEKDLKENEINQIRPFLIIFFIKLAFDYFYCAFLTRRIFHLVENSH